MLVAKEEVAKEEVAAAIETAAEDASGALDALADVPHAAIPSLSIERNSGSQSANSSSSINSASTAGGVAWGVVTLCFPALLDTGTWMRVTLDQGDVHLMSERRLPTLPRKRSYSLTD